jgi:hypothetical protein
MKSLLLLVVGLLVVSGAFSQEKVLSISNAETGKESVFKQNESIKIKTVEGDKIKGNLSITDENQIMINQILVPVSSIEKIKRHPVALNILVSAGLFLIGAYTVFGGWLILAWSGEGIGALLIHTGVASFATGIFLPNIYHTVGKNASILKIETLYE